MGLSYHRLVYSEGTYRTPVNIKITVSSHVEALETYRIPYEPPVQVRAAFPVLQRWL